MDEGYSAEFDTVDATTWSDMLDRFDDASIYQTWSYDAVRRAARRREGASAGNGSCVLAMGAAMASEK
jgi:hypothetical protein